MKLDELMRRAGVWRGGEMAAAPGFSTGYQALDETLPGGGWPATGLTELLCEGPGIGALSLVLPALARLSRAGHWIIWVAPPHIPYSPALIRHGVDLARVLIVDLPEEADDADTESLWAYEQALRFPDCGAALLWLGDVADLRLRRLQLAAEAGETWGVLFRPRQCGKASSPAPLRLGLEPCRAAPATAALQVTVVKARGGHYGSRCRIEF